MGVFLGWLKNNKNWLLGIVLIAGSAGGAAGLLVAYLAPQTSGDTQNVGGDAVAFQSSCGDIVPGNNATINGDQSAVVINSNNDGPATITADNNSVVSGITEAEYLALLQEQHAEFEAVYEELRQKLLHAIRTRGRHSVKAQRLEGQLRDPENTVRQLKGKIAYIEYDYVQMQETIVRLQDDLQVANTSGCLPTDIYDEALAALAQWDLDTVEKLIAPLLNPQPDSDTIRDEAQIYYIAGQIAVERFDFSTGMARAIRAAELVPDEVDYLLLVVRNARIVDDYPKVEQFAKAAEALAPPNTHQHLSAIHNLASALQEQDKFAEAEVMRYKELDVSVKVLGENHHYIPTVYKQIIIVLMEQGSVLMEQGKVDEAEAMHRKSLDLTVKQFGENHPQTPALYNNLAEVLHAQDKFDEAEAMHRKALEFWLELLGENHPRTATSYNNLAETLRAQGKLDKAEAMYRKALDIAAATLGPEHPNTRLFYKNYVHLLKAMPQTSQRDAEIKSLIDQFGMPE